MAGLFGSKSQASQTPAITGLQVQTSAYGKVIPVVYGETRVPGNLIWYANFKQWGSGGGKGGGKGGLMGGCFDGSTLISLRGNGSSQYQAIRDVAVGDKVMSYDPESDELCEGTVVETHQHVLEDTPDKFLLVMLEDGSSVLATDNHYFWRLDHRLVPIGDYREGDVVMMQDGSLREIVGIIRDIPQATHSFNLTVEPYHNYFANRCLVHNGGGGKSSKQTVYTADVMIAICEGPVNDITHVWVDKTYEAVSAIQLAAGIIPGHYGEGVWTYLNDNYPTQAIAYSGIAKLVAAYLNLGSSGAMPNINYDVQGVLYGSASNGIDADPGLVAIDILSNEHYGVGMLSGEVGHVYTNTEDLVVSGGTATVSEAANFLQNCDVVVGTGPHVGTILTCVASSPTVDQYTFSAGVYSFNAGLEGEHVLITYAWVNQLINYRSWCALMQLGISPAYTDQTAANSLLDDIAKYTFSEWVWSSGVLDLVPRGSITMTNGTSTYTAPTALFDLTDDDYLPNQGGGGSSSASTSDDPVIVTRIRQSDQDNDIQLEFVDRSNQYATAIAEATDQALIDQFRRRFSGSQTAHLFADVTAANVSAQLLLQKEYVKNTYAVTLPQQYIILDPMDVVTLTDSYLGLVRKPCRVTEMTENDDGSINFSLEEIPEGTGSAAIYSFNTGQGYNPDYGVVPGDVAAPAIFNAPTELGNGLPTVFIAVSNTDVNYGGCNLYVSSDNSTYTLVGTISGNCNTGVTTNNFAAGADPDTTNVLDLDMSNSGGELISYSTTDADSGISLCYLGSDNGGEFIAYETATLTGTNTYTLGSYIRRGMFHSPNTSHGVATVFTRMDNTIFKYVYPKSFTGTTLYFKFTSFNKFGQGEQALSDVTSYTHTLTGVSTVQPLSVAHLSLTPKSFTP